MMVATQLRRVGGLIKFLYLFFIVTLTCVGPLGLFVALPSQPGA